MVRSIFLIKNYIKNLRNMENKDDRMDRIISGIHAAYKKMLEYKIRNNQKVVTTDTDGVVRAINAKVVYERVYGEVKSDTDR